MPPDLFRRAASALTTAFALAQLLCPTIHAAPPDLLPAAGGVDGLSGSHDKLPEEPQHAVWFVMNAEALAADLGPPCPPASPILTELGDRDVAWVLPGSGEPAAPVFAPTETLALTNTWDDVWTVHWGDVDALGIRRYGGLPARPHRGHLVFSCQAAWGGATEWNMANAAGAVDGSLFRLLRDTDGSGHRVSLFLRELLIVKAIGQLGQSGNGVDVDAFVQDEDGNLFLSFRHDELVGGVLVGDGSVICIPAWPTTYNGLHDVVDVLADSAVVIWDDAIADGMVAHAGLVKPTGAKIDTLGDLQALALDPVGGTFTSLNPVPGVGTELPNLLFNGQNLGPTVLTTRTGGRVARVNGHPLGAKPIHGGPLGLDPDTTGTSTADLNGLLVVPAAAPPVHLDVASSEVHLSAGETIQVGIAHLPPGGAALLLVDIGMAPAASFPAPPWAFYPDLFALGLAWGEVLVADAHGQVAWTHTVPVLPDMPFVTSLQALDLVRGELSTPALVSCPFP